MRTTGSSADLAPAPLQTTDSIDPDAVRAQLSRILASPEFVNAERLSRFVRFAVDQVLEGKGDRLKEYVLGVEVFDRDERYDPRLDSIVRVEARRLRTKLAEYYTAGGTDDPVLIHLPKGTYVPQFARRAERAETPIDAAPVSRRRRSSPLRWLLVGMVVATAVAGVLAVRVGRDQGRAGVKGGAPALSLAVLPFVAYGRVAPGLADRLTDGLIGEMTREANVAVRSRTSVMPFRGVQRSLREVATALDADLVMEGSVASEGGKLIVEARLVHSAADRKLWAEEFEGSSNDLRALQRQIATAAAAAIRRVR